VKKFDPTSHGEVEAVRDACRNLRTTDLTGCELYTSCEPCSVCTISDSVSSPPSSTAMAILVPPTSTPMN